MGQDRDLAAFAVDVVERSYLNLPLPGEPGYDGVRHDSEQARTAAAVILRAAFPRPWPGRQGCA